MKRIFILLVLNILIFSNFSCYLFGDQERIKYVYYSKNGLPHNELINMKNKINIMIRYPYDYYNGGIPLESKKSNKVWENKSCVRFQIINYTNIMLSVLEFKLELMDTNGMPILCEKYFQCDDVDLCKIEDETYVVKYGSISNDSNAYNVMDDFFFMYPMLKDKKLKLKYKIKAVYGEEVFDFEGTDEIEYNYGYYDYARAR